MSVLSVVFVVCMLLWFFSALPVSQLTPYNWAHPLLAWICVAILGFSAFGFR